MSLGFSSQDKVKNPGLVSGAANRESSHGVGVPALKNSGGKDMARLRLCGLWVALCEEKLSGGGGGKLPVP